MDGEEPSGGESQAREEELEKNPSLIDKILQYHEAYLTDPEVMGSLKTVTTQEGALRIQYNGKTGEDGYEYDAYIPDLVTNLNFAATMSYNGNITGPDNMKLNVDSGTLTYGGKADVVGVYVADGASLLGGSYIVHDMSRLVAADFASKLDDSDKGYFINRGTIGAVDSESSMTIDGDPLSDGILLGVAGGSAGTIQVSGSANINSAVIAKDMLPGDTFTVLTAAEGVTGSPKNNSKRALQVGSAG